MSTTNVTSQLFGNWVYETFVEISGLNVEKDEGSRLSTKWRYAGGASRAMAYVYDSLDRLVTCSLDRGGLSAYCAANPIRYIDPTGCKIEISDKSGWIKEMMAVMMKSGLFRTVRAYDLYHLIFN